MERRDGGNGRNVQGCGLKWIEKALTKDGQEWNGQGEGVARSVGEMDQHMA